MSKPKRPSGGACIAAAGKSAILIGVTPAQKEKLRAAADLETRPLTQFLVHHGLMAAEKILRKSGNSG